MCYIAWMPGQPLQYEHFEILVDEEGRPRRLGKGGMGATFRAYDTRLRRPVALKIINERALAQASMRRRFFNEARAAALIDHPHVARVLYLCPEEAEECFFAMELIEGESLADLVAWRGPRPADEALALLRPVVEALGALAAEHLVHRDLKPGNIMVTTSGMVKLIDFGVVKPLGPGSERFDPVQSDGGFVGSLFFASPEQVLGRQALDARSDFYALGVTLWHLLTGAPPFTGTSFEVQDGHLHQEPDFSVLAAQPRALVALLARLLAKSPADRPADVPALLAAWDEARDGLGEMGLPQVESEAFTETLLDLPPPLACHPLDPPPVGFAAPAPPARLAVEEASGAWCAVRTVPARAGAKWRAGFFAGAHAVAAAPHAGLLAVREVRPDRAVSAWPRALPAANVLALRRDGLPFEIVARWLPAAAAAVDWAAAHGFARIGLAVEQWLICFVELDDGESPLLRAARSPEQWGATHLLLDPLAGFDSTARIESETHSGHTQVRGPDAPLGSRADFLAALARALHQIFSGHRDRPDSPLPALGEVRNRLLREAIEQRSAAGTVAEWVGEFLGVAESAAPASAGPAREIAEAAPTRPASAPWRGKTAAWIALAVLVGAVAFLLRPPPGADHSDDEVVPHPPLAPEAPNPSPLLAVTRGAPFRNSLDMEFIPVAIVGAPPAAPRILFSRYETRRRDYAAFAGEVRVIADDWRAPEIAGVKMPTGSEADAHPVIAVSWEDAVAFCAWLTARERQEGRLRADESYRLPTDHEWSCAAGLGEEEDAAQIPRIKSGALADRFPWGRGILPANPAPAPYQPLPENYAGEEGRGTWAGIIEGYADDFLATAPVGSFPPNVLGLHDLSGNAWEWCLEEWDDTDSAEPRPHILRGASCLNSLPNLLNLSFRRSAAAGRIDLTGFRIVLVSSAP